MTKKNARKSAARARQRAHGGNYLAHLHIVSGSRETPKPDVPENEKNDLAAKDHAIRAAFLWVQGPLVGIVQGRVGKPMGFNGSGTIIKTPGGRAAILTCSHVLEDGLSYSATCIGIDEGIDDIAAGFIRHPDPDVDAALVRLKPEAERRLLLRAVEWTAVAVPGEDDVGEGHWTIAVGFPATYRKDYRRGKKVIVQTLGAITFGCFVEGVDDKGRFRIGWKEAVPQEPSRIWEESLAQKKTPVQPLPDPHGISGGALWRFGKVPRDVVWSMKSAGKLIGIPCAWHPGEAVQFAEPAKRWGEWFARSLREIDSSP